MKNTMILGNSGTGKTTLIKKISEKLLKKYKNHIQIITIDFTGEFKDWTKECNLKYQPTSNLFRKSAVTFDLSNFIEKITGTKDCMNAFATRTGIILKNVEHWQKKHPDLKIVLNLPEGEKYFSEKYMFTKDYEKMYETFARILRNFTKNKNDAVILEIPDLNEIMDSKHIDDDYSYTSIDNLTYMQQAKIFNIPQNNLDLLKHVYGKQVVDANADKILDLPFHEYITITNQPFPNV